MRWSWCGRAGRDGTIVVMPMRPRDTSERAAALQTQLQNSLTPEDRVLLALKFSGFALEFARAALAQRHPDFTEADVSRALILELHGRK